MTNDFEDLNDDWDFISQSANKIELLEATKENSPINKFIEKKGEGIHHIAEKACYIKRLYH